MGVGLYRILEGESIAILSSSSAVANIRARFRVHYDSGRDDAFVLQDITTEGTRSLERFATESRALEAGWIVGAVAGTRTSPLKRGQCYIQAHVGRDIGDAGGLTQQILFQDYLYQGYNPTLGIFHGPGPGSGNGFKNNRILADDVAPVDVEHTLGITNALRRIDGFIWYYHCSSDVATRTMRVSVRDLGEGLPTGMTSGGNTLVKAYPSAGNLSLTQDQEGLIYVNANTGKSFAISVDNGTPVIEDITTDPDPFPYWARENEVGELFFDVGAAEAADRHSIYIIEEEWIEG